MLHRHSAGLKQPSARSPGRACSVRLGGKTNASWEEAMIGRLTVTLVFAVLLVAMAAGKVDAQPKPQSKPVLDYEFYKARVEPIFLKKKPGHTRGVVCHSESNNSLKLEPLERGTKA